MGCASVNLTPAETRFRIWMWLSAWMYGLGAPLFLLLGRQVAAFLNGLPGTLLQRPPWPSAGEGMEVVFWQVLGVSLMVILSVLCWHIARDVRRYGPLIVALLGAKLISSLCYAVLFAGSGNLAFLIAVLTDGSIFLLSWVLWFLASPADRFMDEKETRVLAAVGEALLPCGGPYPQGYADVREACLSEAGRLLAAQPAGQVVLTRIMLRIMDLLPLLKGRFHRFHRLNLSERARLFEALEKSRFNVFRFMAAALKLYTVTPFFNLPEMAEHIINTDAQHQQPGTDALDDPDSD